MAQKTESGILVNAGTAAVAEASATPIGNPISTKDFDVITVQVTTALLTPAGASFTPYLYTSTDQGNTWSQIAAGGAMTTNTTELVEAGIGTANNHVLGDQVQLEYVLTGSGTPGVNVHATATLKG